MAVLLHAIGTYVGSSIHTPATRVALHTDKHTKYLPRYVGTAEATWWESG